MLAPTSSPDYEPSVDPELPIHAVRGRFEEALRRGAVVVSSPTGSGKSTEIPRWISANGRVLVVEPRRVACRSLAARVAELEATRLGERVGYVVRDESAATRDSRIVFATPGIVLHSPSMAGSFDVLVLDELHERSLDLDLLIALFARRPGAPKLVAMSATLDGDRVARFLGGQHVQAHGRAFPVEIRYLESSEILPSPKDLAARVGRAIELAANDPGDVLVFLPGKSEIDACARLLRALPMDIVPLHGSLGLGEQRRAFEPSRRRKVVLATNVAETSITLPGVGVVIDSGLVRRTHYHGGRSYLALSPIAEDAAAQRTGRAGRTGPGVCVRLYSARAKLAAVTPPEIHRESLVPMVLTAAAWGERLEDLPMLDPAKPRALEEARSELLALGAIDAEGAITQTGRELFGLPLDPALARLLVAAKESGCLEDAIDLVSALATGRPLLVPVAAEDAASEGPACDATRLVLAVRSGGDGGVSSVAREEALRTRERLRRAYGLETAPRRTAIDREALVRAAITADPRSAYVARARGRDIVFANGGTELELARESSARRAKDIAAAVVFESRAFGVGPDARILATCVSPIALGTIASLGLGRDRIASVRLERGKIVASIERVYAKRVIASRDEAPTGELARDAIATLFIRGSIFRDALAQTKERLALRALASRLGPDALFGEGFEPPPALDEWVRERLATLGIEQAEDLALLSAADLIADDLPAHVRAAIERDYPRIVSVGDATYEADYDVERREVLLRMVRGSRKEPPPLAYLPKFPGFRIAVAGARGVSVLRTRG